MAASGKTPLKSTAIVFAFWGFSFSVIYADGLFNYPFIVFACIIVFFGFFLSRESSVDYRRHLKDRLIGKSAKGISSTIGDVPLHNSQLPMAKDLDFKKLATHLPPELNDLEFVESYISRYEKSHPHYVSLFKDILKTFMHQNHVVLKATYDVDATGDIEINNPSQFRHGGRGLLSHSLLVCNVILREADSFLADFSNPKQKRAHDIDFRSDPNDPLIGLLGLSHDIGKLMTFKPFLNDKNEIVVKRIKDRHDTQGSIVMALFDSFWNPAIPAEDRCVIQNVMSFYHHPSDMPFLMMPDGSEKVCSDREFALLHLLIHADTVAGAYEHGKDFKDVIRNDQDVSEEINPDDIIDNFAMFLASNNDVNLPKNHKNVAFKVVFEEKTLLIFDNKLFINSFADFLKSPHLKDLKRGSSPHPLVSNLLIRLDELGVVYRPKTDLSTNRSADLCIYKCEFFTADEPEPFLKLGETFTLDITNWDLLARLKTIPSSIAIPKFGSNRYGARGVYKKLLNVEIAGTATPDAVHIKDLKVRKDLDNPDLARIQIKRALSSKKLKEETKTEINGRSCTVLLGQDEWFSENGLSLTRISALPDFLLKCGIAKITPSKKMPNLHVVAIYDDF